ncbi:DegV family protein [Alteracholeplasma palmae J233]|uniref:DegV family protein n=1 Tax=Alteracholeplasma palmae (strain ATCC 49389 / J233) TaxID=1318466 RepID=U4KND4_ALTPJ|nr:DegV family protein [Alteracholeplasma palmae]CCV63690.1 DegV family protein [Alteracholeplasma palmae J233]
MEKRKVGIVVDSTCGAQFKDKIFKDASIVPLTVLVDDVPHTDGTLDNVKLLKYMHENKKVTTSQPSPDLFLKAYQEQFDLGYESIVCFVLSSGLSGTYNSANLAKTIIENENIIIVDTKTVGPGVTYLLERLNEIIKNSNLPIKEIVEELMTKEAETGSLFFSVDHLATLVKGGRLTRLQAMVGNLLKIKPILRFKNSVLSIEKKARGKQAVYDFFVNEAKTYLTSLTKTIIKIVYVDDASVAKELEHELNMIKNENLVTEIYGPISPVVATHLGYRGIGIYINHEV